MRVTPSGTVVALVFLVLASSAGASPAPELIAPEDGAGGQHVSITFSWKAVSDNPMAVDHYELIVDDGRVGQLAPSDCTDTCSLTVSSLRETAHRWYVAAVNKAGTRSVSETRTFTVAVPPVAVLVATPARVLVGRPVTLDASGSTDEGSGITHYEFDTDGDGTFGADAGGDATIEKTYYTPTTIRVGVKVTDDAGLSSTATAILVVTAVPPDGQPGIAINNGAQYTNSPTVSVSAVWPRFASNIFLSNESSFLTRTGFPVAAQTPWTLDASGSERVPKTVYARYLGGTEISETFSDDIILDQTAPKVLAAQLHTSRGVVVLHVKAKDTVSGVGNMQVTPDMRKPGKLLAYKNSVNVKPAKALYVRVRDRAGNFSPWRTAKRG